MELQSTDTPPVQPGENVMVMLCKGCRDRFPQRKPALLAEIVNGQTALEIYAVVGRSGGRTFDDGGSGIATRRVPMRVKRDRASGTWRAQPKTGMIRCRRCHRRLPIGPDQLLARICEAGERGERTIVV